jgi:hypothetical protein
MYVILQVDACANSDWIGHDRPGPEAANIRRVGFVRSSFLSAIGSLLSALSFFRLYFFDII